MQNIHTSGIKKKEYTHMSQQLEIWTYNSMNKQYVEGVQKWKKANLTRKSKIAKRHYRFPGRVRDTSLLFKEQRHPTMLMILGCLVLGK